jgi:hypothetical protein
MKKAKDSNYHKRRRHIKKLIEEVDVNFYDICKWAGRWDGNHDTNSADDSKYHYVWQVVSGKYDTKTSISVLDDLEQTLRDNDLWIERSDMKE